MSRIDRGQRWTVRYVHRGRLHVAYIDDIAVEECRRKIPCGAVVECVRDRQLPLFHNGVDVDAGLAARKSGL